MSVCSGIEAASVAWAPLGWRPAAFAEIDPHACHVLAERHGASRPLFMPEPDADPRARRARLAAIKRVAALPEVGAVPNFGDLTRFKEWPDAAIDLLVGGTPCQSFSVAGLRAGLADPRGNLALTFLAVADRYRPQWIIWENVPGVLSINKGRDFGSFLGGLGQLGFGWCYRVLDAQHVRVDGFPRAVPQRRRRVFVVGYLGDWRPAAALLLELESLRGDPAPRREARKGVAGTLAGGSRERGGYSHDDVECVPVGDLAGASKSLNATSTASGYMDPSAETFVATTLRARATTKGVDSDATDTLVPVASSVDVLPLKARGDETANGAGIGRVGDPAFTLDTFGAAAIAFSAKDHGADASDEVAPTLRAAGHAESHANSGAPPAIAFDARQRDACVYGDPAAPLDTDGFSQAIAFDPTQITHPENRSQPEPGGPCHTLAKAGHAPAVATAWAVRRLTPVECERLQGFSDGYTAVRYGKRPMPDGPRYKALGNSMAVNCMRWLGERLEMVRSLMREVGQ